MFSIIMVCNSPFIGLKTGYNMLMIVAFVNHFHSRTPKPRLLPLLSLQKQGVAGI